MAHTLAGCVELVQTAEQTGRILQICHVLRYTPFWRTLHDIVDSGRLGDIMTVEHRENVAYWHMAHSFVRGNWRNAGLSSPMILAKCCHDLDILVWNLRVAGASAQFVRLAAALSAPTRSGQRSPRPAPTAAPLRPSCAFSALGIYLDQRLLPRYAAQAAAEAMADRGAPPGLAVLPSLPAEHELRRTRLAAFQTGPYGRCVYHCDNDVVDHQVVSMELENGSSVALVMHGHSNEEHRSMRYDGTRATLRARFGEHSEITVYDHATQQRRDDPARRSGERTWRRRPRHHGRFPRRRARRDPPLTNARTSLESHLLAFAAEEARTGSTVVDMRHFRAAADVLAARIRLSANHRIKIHGDSRRNNSRRNIGGYVMGSGY